jgi:hypothetical protein
MFGLCLVTLFVLLCGNWRCFVLVDTENTLVMISNEVKVSGDAKKVTKKQRVIRFRL